MEIIIMKKSNRKRLILLTLHINNTRYYITNYLSGNALKYNMKGCVLFVKHSDTTWHLYDVPRPHDKKVLEINAKFPLKAEKSSFS